MHKLITQGALRREGSCLDPRHGSAVQDGNPAATTLLRAGRAAEKCLVGQSSTATAAVLPAAAIVAALEHGGETPLEDCARGARASGRGGGFEGLAQAGIERVSGGSRCPRTTSATTHAVRGRTGSAGGALVPPTRKGRPAARRSRSGLPWTWWPSMAGAPGGISNGKQE
jgi:hypothetical protein